LKDEEYKKIQIESQNKKKRDKHQVVEDILEKTYKEKDFLIGIKPARQSVYKFKVKTIIDKETFNKGEISKTVIKLVCLFVRKNCRERRR
jgi:hypothetical protein